MGVLATRLGTLLARADGLPGTGLGHLARTSALADAWERRGGTCALATTTPAPAASFWSGRPIETLSAPIGSPADLSRTLDLARRVRARWVLCDGYELGPGYVHSLRTAGFRVVQIDDGTFRAECRADLLVDQNIGSERAPYALASGGRQLLGARFVLLRSEILRLSRHARTNGPRRILALSGGSDAGRVTPTFVRAFRSAAGDGATCDVVLGPAALTLDETLDAAAGDDRVRIHRRPEALAELLQGATMALTPAGSTCWELCYLGIPMAVVAVAENQVQIAEGLAAAGAALSMDRRPALTIERVARSLRRMLDDRPALDAMGERARALVDGRGGERVVDAMLGEASV